MARLIKIDSLGLVNVHKFQHNTTRAIVRVECTDREYADLGVKGGGPPPRSSWPSPARDYTWIGSVGGADKFAADKYGLAPGEMHYRDNRYRIQPHDATQKMIITDLVRDTITGDVTSRNTTITISPDPVRPTGGTWKIVDGDLSIR